VFGVVNRAHAALPQPAENLEFGVVGLLGGHVGDGSEGWRQLSQGSARWHGGTAEGRLFRQHNAHARCAMGALLHHTAAKVLRTESLITSGTRRREHGQASRRFLDSERTGPGDAVFPELKDSETIIQRKNLKLKLQFPNIFHAT
jgi:hypothetical protein